VFLRLLELFSSFGEALLKEEKNPKACLELGVDEAKEMRESAWGSRLASCLKVLGKSSLDIESVLKSASWKIAVAGYMKKRMLCRNGWLAERLGMGTQSAVARCSSELFRGERNAAEKDMKILMTKVLD